MSIAGEHHCSDRRLIDEARKRVALLHHGQSSCSEAPEGTADHGSSVLHAQWDHHVMDFMAGRTLASKVSLPVLYSTAICFLGWQQPLAWTAMLTAILGLHAVLPRLYITHYLQPLHAVRELAAKHRLRVSSSLRIMEWDQQLLFEMMAAERSSCGRVKDAWMIVGLFAVYGGPCVLLLAAKGYAAASLAPLLLGAFVFVLLRAQAISRGQHGRRQWVDLAAEVYCSALHWLPPLVDGFPVSSILRGTSEVMTACYGVSILALLRLAKVLVLEKPVQWCIVSEVALAAVISFIIGPAIAPIFAEASGLSGTYPLVQYVYGACSLLFAVVCVALRAKSEAGYLQDFLSREPEKYHGHVLRPRMGLVCKLPNGTPADLPQDLRQQMLNLAEVEVESLHGHIRPGCLLLSLSYRFGDVASLEAGRAAVLAGLRSTAAAAGLPWAQMDAVVCVGDTRFTVQGGMVVKEEAVLSPVIVTVDRLALFETKTLTLKALGLGIAPFTVVLRTASEYVDLEVMSAHSPDCDTKMVTVRLPEATKLGMAWLELHSHVSSDCPVISEGFPLMFAPTEGLAEELSKTLLLRLPTIRHVASLLEDVANCVCGEISPTTDESDERSAARLLSEVVRLELPECFSLLALQRDMLESALSVPPGLLSTVVKSQSEIMLNMVLAALDMHGLPFEPCRIPDADEVGLSPLHLAAQQGSLRMICSLLDAMPDAEEQWHTLRSGVCVRTPADLMEARWPWFSIHTLLETLPSCRGRAVWGTDLVTALSLKTTASLAVFHTLYSVILAAVGWREPLAWLTVAVLSSGLHVLAPFLHKHYYVQRLEEVRKVAQSCKLRVTQGMKIMDAAVQRAYEQNELWKSSLHPIESSLLFMAAVLPAALLPAWQSWNLWGEVEQWTIAQAVVALGALTLARWWAVKTVRLGVRQLVDLVAWNYCVCMTGCHRLVCWASGTGVCWLPAGEFMEALKNKLGFAAAVCVLGVGVALLLKMLVVSGPPSAVAWLEPLFGASQICLLGYIVAPWCFNLLTGGDIPPALVHVCLAFWFVGNLCCLGVQVRSEAGRLHRFLAHLPDNPSAKFSKASK